MFSSLRSLTDRWICDYKQVCFLASSKFPKGLGFACVLFTLVWLFQLPEGVVLPQTMSLNKVEDLDLAKGMEAVPLMCSTQKISSVAEAIAVMYFG